MAFTITFSEMHGWPKSRWDRGRFTGVRKLICDWGDRLALLTELDSMTGWTPTDWPSLANNVWPYADGNSYCLAQAATIEPLPGEMGSAGGSLGSYEKALITVTYSNRQNYIHPTDYTLVNEQLQPTADTQLIDPTGLYWEAAGPVGQGETLKRLSYSLDYVLTFYNVNSVPLAAYQWVGAINTDTVASFTLGVTFPQETLLYKPPSASRTISLAGSNKWDITLQFEYRPGSWNAYWSKAAGAYRYVTVGSGGSTYKDHPLLSFNFAPFLQGYVS